MARRLCGLWAGCILAVLGSTTPPAFAEDCFGGGVNCEDAARAAFAFRIARDCGSVIVVRPSRAREFARIMDLVRRRPLSILDGDRFSTEPHAMQPGDCGKVVRALATGTPDQRAGLAFLALRPSMRRPSRSGG